MMGNRRSHSREPIYDTSNVLILDNQGATIYSNRSGINPTFTSEYETFLAATKENRPRYMEGIYDIYRELALRQLDDKLIRFYPMNGRTTDSLYKEYHGGTDIAPVGADADPEFNGLAGDGSALHYTLGTEASDRIINLITDPNNFSIGIYSQTDDDAGTDFGCSVGTNFCTIACKSGGDAVIKVGTTTVSDGITTGKGHFIMNVQSGMVKAWQGVSKVLTELESNVPIGGSLPDAAPILCAEDDDGTPTDYSSKRISALWIYNGLLDDDGVNMMNQLIENYHLYTGKSVNYGA
jgi:hypothetical protein